MSAMSSKKKIEKLQTLLIAVFYITHKETYME